MPREFRTRESYDAEQVTRGMVASFLRERGFRGVHDQRIQYGRSQSQIISAIDASGRRVSMVVRLCWRKRSKGPEEKFAAAQLMAEISNGDWIGSLSRKVDREASDGRTHYLVVERSDNEIRHAALIPIDSVVRVWMAQRDARASLISHGSINKRPNHAMNGASPTLYLREDSAPEVPAALWTSFGVRDLAFLRILPTSVGHMTND